MSYIILVFAVTMVIIGIITLFKPTAVFGLMSNHSQSLTLHVFAVLTRIFVGAALVLSAQNSEFPLILKMLGWLFIVAGMVLAVIGRNRFKTLVKWALNLIPQYGFAVSVFAILFGGFLGYAVL